MAQIKKTEYGEGEESRRLLPIEEIGEELVRVAQGDPAVRLRQLVQRVYPRTGKEDSMRFLAVLTKLRQAAEVAYQSGSDVHAEIMNMT